MSLINRMLQDLDRRQRHAGTIDAAVARPVPVTPVGRSGRLWWIGIAVLLLSVALAVLLLLSPQNEPPQQPASGPMQPASLPDEGVEQQPKNMPQPEIVDQNSEPESVASKRGSQEEAAIGVKEHLAASKVDRQPAALEEEGVMEPLVAPAPVVEAIPRQEPAAVPEVKKPAVPEPEKSSAKGKPTAGDRATRLLSKAEDFLVVGRIAEAESELQRALKLNPKKHRARELLVGLMLRSGRDNSAALLLAEGRRLAPEHELFALLQVRLLLQQGRRYAAIELLKEMEHSAGSGTQILTMLAALLQQDGRHQEAADVYRRLVKTDPDNGNHWVGLGISLEAMGMVSEAVAAYDRSMRGAILSPELGSYAAERLKALRY